MIFFQIKIFLFFSFKAIYLYMSRQNKHYFFIVIIFLEKSNMKKKKELKKNNDKLKLRT